MYINRCGGDGYIGHNECKTIEKNFAGNEKSGVETA